MVRGCGVVGWEGVGSLVNVCAGGAEVWECVRGPGCLLRRYNPGGCDSAERT